MAHAGVREIGTDHRKAAEPRVREIGVLGMYHREIGLDIFGDRPPTFAVAKDGNLTKIGISEDGLVEHCAAK